MHLAFITLVDPTGTSGQNLFSREIAGAISRHDDVHLSLVCPRPVGDLPESLSSDTVRTYFLPRKPYRTPEWHLKVQPSLIRSLWSIQRHEIDGIVTPLKPGLITPPLVAAILSVPQVLLVEGMTARNVEKITPFSGPGRIVDFVATINAVNSQCIFASYEKAKDWIVSLPFVSRDKVDVFNHGVDVDLFRPMDRRFARNAIPVDMPDDGFVLGYIGSFKPYHCLQPLVRGLGENSDLRKVHLLLVGDGPERDRIAELAREYGIGDRVMMPGFIEHEQVPTYIAACDATYGIVDPAHWGSPMKVYEYLACARPVISYMSKEFEFINITKSGEVVPEISEDAIGKAVSTIEGKSRDEREKMGNRGRKYIVENRTWDSLAQKIVNCMG